MSKICSSKRIGSHPRWWGRAFTGRHLLVGLSPRTNEAGAAYLKDVFASDVDVIVVPNDKAHSLHLKCALTHLDEINCVVSSTPAALATARAVNEAVKNSTATSLNRTHFIQSGRMIFCKRGPRERDAAVLQPYERCDKVLLAYSCRWNWRREPRTSPMERICKSRREFDVQISADEGCNVIRDYIFIYLDYTRFRCNIIMFKR